MTLFSSVVGWASGGAACFDRLQALSRVFSPKTPIYWAGRRGGGLRADDGSPAAATGDGCTGREDERSRPSLAWPG